MGSVLYMIPLTNVKMYTSHVNRDQIGFYHMTNEEGMIKSKSL